MKSGDPGAEILHIHPCPNEQVAGLTLDEIEELFIEEFNDFRHHTGVVALGANCGGRWNTNEARDGKSHLWHGKWTLPYTKVLGFAGARFTSQPLGIGQCERGGM